MSTYRDFDFLRSTFEGWMIGAWGLTLVRDMSPVEFISAVRARVLSESATGCTEVCQAWWPVDSEGFLIGVADVGEGWTLVVETTVAYMGVTELAIAPVARDHDLVAIHGGTRFGSVAWWVNGVAVAIIPNVAQPDYDSPFGGAQPRCFEMIWASVAPDGIADWEERDLEWVIPQALFAATETITGVALDEEMLARTRFHLAVVPAPVPAAASEFAGRLRRAEWDVRNLD